MNLYRIYSLTIRYWIVGIREINRLFSIIYFPVLDVALWGYMSLWMQRSSSSSINIVMIYLAAIVLWDTIWTINNEQSLNLLEELESRNVVNLFSTPITLGEWIVAGIILSVTKALFTLFFASGVAWLFYGINIFSLGWSIAPLALLFICSGLALSFFLNGILIRGGQQIAILIWSVPYLILTFSAPFYPVSLLPQWVQYFAKSLPTTYTFEALRHLIEHGKLPIHDIFMSTALNILYFIVAILFFNYMFNKSKELGLAQLEQE